MWKIQLNIHYVCSTVKLKLPNSISKLHDYLCVYEIKINTQEDILY